jgi:Glucose-regulated metallo-peptidase M90
MFANLLALPFVFGALTFLYLAWTVDNKYAPYMIPFLIVGAIIYIMSPQINWWWYSKNMPKLSEGLTKLLKRFCLFYQNLPAADKRKFEGRVGLFRMGTNWTPIGWPDDEMPPDVELALAAQAVSLTFHREQFLFPVFEKVIVYPKAFPSPNHPYPHSSELHEADGCLIFSAEHLMKAYFNPGQLYQIGLHEYAKAFVLAYPGEDWPVLEGDQVWEGMETLSGMSREHVENVVGLTGLDALPVAIHHYFMFPLTFKKAFPEISAQLDKIFSPQNLIE